MMPEDIAPNRVPSLERACNFRDFGGYETRDGRRVRWGQLYRSGSLTQLTDLDRSTIGALGIRAICDLRRLDERSRHPDPEFGPGVTHLYWDEPGEASSLRGESFAQSVGGAEARAAMIWMYAQMPVTLVTRVRGMFASLLQGPGAPMILHCMAGKDRTGFAVAMLLSALDVPHNVIVEDYVLTNRRRRPARSITGRGAGWPRYRRQRRARPCAPARGPGRRARRRRGLPRCRIRCSRPNTGQSTRTWAT